MNESLSCWDCLCLDWHSRPTDGLLGPSLCGVQVEFCRNVLLIRDDQGWRPSSGLHRPFCAAVRHGLFSYQDVYILAARGPRDSIQAVCWFDQDQDVRGIAGLALPGYSSGSAPVYLGVLPEDVESLSRRVRRWKEKQLLPENFPDLDWSKSLRFCQGDRLIAAGNGVSTPCTPPGMASPPLIHSGGQ